MPTQKDKRTEIYKEFPGDEALQQIHLARKALVGSMAVYPFISSGCSRDMNISDRSAS